MKKLLSWIFTKYSDKIYIGYQFVKDTSIDKTPISSVECRFIVASKSDNKTYSFNSCSTVKSAIETIPNTRSAYDAFVEAQKTAILMSLSVSPPAMIIMDEKCKIFNG